MKRLENYKECIFVAESGNDDILVINRVGLCVSTLSPGQFGGLVSAGLLARSRAVGNAIVYKIAS